MMLLATYKEQALGPFRAAAWAPQRWGFRGPAYPHAGHAPLGQGILGFVLALLTAVRWRPATSGADQGERLTTPLTDARLPSHRALLNTS
jgi:hypothetical protein